MSGIPKEYHISCRVRSSLAGIDEEPSEHANYVIQAASPMLALSFWLTDVNYKEKAWLRCSTDDLNRLLALPKNEQIDFSSVPGADGSTDWDVHEIDTYEDIHVVEMCGTANLSEFEFEIRISPAVSNVETYGCKAPTQLLQELTRLELEEIVGHAQRFLFFDVIKDDGDGSEPIRGWYLDKDVSGADYIDHMTEVLSEYDLVPVPE